MRARQTTIHINQIYDARFLQAVIQQAYRCGQKSSKRDDSDATDASLHLMFMEQESVSAKLARAIRRKQFHLTEAVPGVAIIDGKARTLYRQIPVDMVVTRAVTAILSALSGNCYSGALYSYRKGTGAVAAISDLRQYFLAHIQNTPDRMQRGLYVLKRDIASYGEAIATHPDSTLWSILREVTIRRFDADEQHPFWQLLVQSIRREIKSRADETAILNSGSPTGSPIQPIINNLYLNPLDQMLSGIPGGFYARYGDDFVFAHPDSGVARQVDDRIDRMLAQLELRVRPEKRKNLYLTVPGKASGTWPATRGATGVDFLGCTVAFRGVVSLKKMKARRFLELMRKRVVAISRLVTGPIAERGCAICHAMNEALDPGSSLADRHAHLLRYIVDDRRQLRHLDYLLARMVAETLGQTRSVKAFRKISYRRIREDFGLHSLVVQKNLMKSRRGHR
jgi:hypothetical protein